MLGSVTNVAIYAINLTTALGMALGIDYSLLMVSRFREELGRGQEAGSRAVVRSVQTAGRTIVFSGATVVSALAVLLIFPLYFLLLVRLRRDRRGAHLDGRRGRGVLPVHCWPSWA